MKKYIVMLCIAAMIVVIGGIVYLFFINPPVPESAIKVELPLDHTNRCISEK